MNEVQVALVGYVASAPSLVMTKAGRFVTNMRVGVTPRRLDRETGQWSDGDTSYVTVTCWRSLAGNVAACLRKGDPVVVKGRLRVRQFDDKDGNHRTVVEVDASTLGHDLTRGVAHFLRTKRSPGDAPAAVGGERPAAGWSGAAQQEPEPELDPATGPDGEFAAADMFDDAGVEASSLQFVSGGGTNGGEINEGEDVGPGDPADGISDAVGAEAGSDVADSGQAGQAA